MKRNWTALGLLATTLSLAACSGPREKVYRDHRLNGEFLSSLEGVSGKDYRLYPFTLAVAPPRFLFRDIRNVDDEVIRTPDGTALYSPLYADLDDETRDAYSAAPLELASKESRRDYVTLGGQDSGAEEQGDDAVAGPPEASVDDPQPATGAKEAASSGDDVSGQAAEDETTATEPEGETATEPEGESENAPEGESENAPADEAPVEPESTPNAAPKDQRVRRRIRLGMAKPRPFGLNPSDIDREMYRRLYMDNDGQGYGGASGEEESAQPDSGSGEKSLEKLAPDNAPEAEGKRGRNLFIKKRELRWDDQDAVDQKVAALPGRRFKIRAQTFTSRVKKVLEQFRLFEEVKTLSSTTATFNEYLADADNQDADFVMFTTFGKNKVAYKGVDLGRWVGNTFLYLGLWFPSWFVADKEYEVHIEAQVDINDVRSHSHLFNTTIQVKVSGLYSDWDRGFLPGAQYLSAIFGSSDWHQRDSTYRNVAQDRLMASAWLEFESQLVSRLHTEFKSKIDSKDFDDRLNDPPGLTIVTVKEPIDGNTEFQGELSRESEGKVTIVDNSGEGDALETVIELENVLSTERETAALPARAYGLSAGISKYEESTHAVLSRFHQESLRQGSNREDYSLKDLKSDLLNEGPEVGFGVRTYADEDAKAMAKLMSQGQEVEVAPAYRNLLRGEEVTRAVLKRQLHRLGRARREDRTFVYLNLETVIVDATSVPESEQQKYPDGLAKYLLPYDAELGLLERQLEPVRATITILRARLAALSEGDRRQAFADTEVEGNAALEALRLEREAAFVQFSKITMDHFERYAIAFTKLVEQFNKRDDDRALEDHESLQSKNALLVFDMTFPGQFTGLNYCPDFELRGGVRKAPSADSEAESADGASKPAPDATDKAAQPEVTPEPEPEAPKKKSRRLRLGYFEALSKTLNASTPKETEPGPAQVKPVEESGSNEPIGVSVRFLEELKRPGLIIALSTKDALRPLEIKEKRQSAFVYHFTIGANRPDRLGLPEATTDPVTGERGPAPTRTLKDVLRYVEGRVSRESQAFGRPQRVRVFGERETSNFAIIQPFE
jgi:hypothetical protein